MRTYMLWYGGGSYATPRYRDLEAFPTFREAKETFQDRETGFDPYYPCVEQSEAWVWFKHKPEDTGDLYPDAVLTLGPRGGVRVEH
jgi:hypothetical protein